MSIMQEYEIGRQQANDFRYLMEAQLSLSGKYSDQKTTDSYKTWQERGAAINLGSSKPFEPLEKKFATKPTYKSCQNHE